MKAATTRACEGEDEVEDASGQPPCACARSRSSASSSYPEHRSRSERQRRSSASAGSASPRSRSHYGKRVTDQGGAVLVISYEDAAGAVIAALWALGGDLDRLFVLSVDPADGELTFPPTCPRSTGTSARPAHGR